MIRKVSIPQPKKKKEKKERKIFFYDNIFNSKIKLLTQSFIPYTPLYIIIYLFSYPIKSSFNSEIKSD